MFQKFFNLTSKLSGGREGRPLEWVVSFHGKYL